MAHTRLATPGENLTVSSPVRGTAQLRSPRCRQRRVPARGGVAPNLPEGPCAASEDGAGAASGSATTTTQHAVLPRVMGDGEGPRISPLRNEHDVASRRSRLACTHCLAPDPHRRVGWLWHPSRCRCRSLHGSGLLLWIRPYGRYGNATSELTYAYNSDGTTTHPWNTVPGNGYNYGGGGYNLNSGTNHNYGTIAIYNPAPVHTCRRPVDTGVHRRPIRRRCTHPVDPPP